jgi:hypothetical protein
MPDGLECLRNQIRDAFPPTCFHGVVTKCSCDECWNIRNALEGRSWNQIEREFIDLTCSPVLLDPEAFQAFLPAYLLGALDDYLKESVVVEFTVYSLCLDAVPDDEDTEPDCHRNSGVPQRLQDRARLMSAAQINAIRAFLSFIAERAAKADGFRPFVVASVGTIWR